MTHRITRRECLKSSAAAAAALTILPAGLARGYAANEKVNVGIIGSGGRGGANLNGVADQGQNIVALCDPDRRHLDGAARRFPDARTYADFRELLSKEKDLEYLGFGSKGRGWLRGTRLQDLRGRRPSRETPPSRAL